MSKSLILTTLALMVQTMPAMAAQDADPALIARGKYLATAADCSACHADDSAGGMAIESPMGAIYASNITPDDAHGIGRWSLKQFSDALRKGRSPDKGWLYPAMPYTSYTGLSDADVAALYAYFHEAVKPVAKEVPETRLPFPFIRPAMIGWNLLNLHVGKASGEIPVQGKQELRGQYLVETLGHCSTCHTPRNALMGEVDDKHLSGGAVGTWTAPNITPSASGIGSWSDADLASFLHSGNAPNGAVAAGDMGLAVEHSLSHLSDEDIAAMVAYLRKVPAVETEGAEAAPAAKLPPMKIDSIEPQFDSWQSKIAAADVTDGERLYVGSCAMCHGITGQGTPDGLRPSLVLNATVRAADPANLVHVIAAGVDRKAAGRHAFMPGFSDELSQPQIAALSSFVRVHFGNRSDGTVSPEQVQKVLSGSAPESWIIRNAAGMAYAAIAVAVLIVIALAAMVIGRRRRRLA